MAAARAQDVRDSVTDTTEVSVDDKIARRDKDGAGA